MVDNLIVSASLRLTSNNLLNTLQEATDAQKKKIFKDTDFRKFIITKLSRSDWGKIMTILNRSTFDYLFDDDFAKMFVNESEEFEYRVDYLNAFLDKDLLRCLKDKDCFFILMQKPYFANVYFTNAKLSYKERKKLLIKALKRTDLIDDEALSIFQVFYYPIKYDYRNLASYEENSQAVQDMQTILSNPEIFKRYSDNFSLLSTLSPENREYLYKDADYSQMDRKQRQILFKLIANNIQFRIPKRIYTNIEFINSIAELQDIGEYRTFINNLSDNNIEAMQSIEAKRKEIYDELIDRFIENKLSKFGDAIYDKKQKKNVYKSNIYSEIYKLNGKHIVYDKFFAACPRDTFLACGVIYDAMQTLPEFKEMLSQAECEIVDKVIDMFNLEIDIYRDYNNLESVSFRPYDEEQRAYRDLNQTNIISNELKCRYQEFCKELLDLEWKLPNKSIAQTLGKMLKSAKMCFSRELIDKIYTPSGRATEIKNGVKIYDISNKNFHCLVHSEGHIDFDYTEVPQGEHEINISMSLIDKNHLILYKSGICLGYSNISSNSVLHALYEDSFTTLALKEKSILKHRFRDAITSYIPSYLDIDNFMANTGSYNEIKIKANPNGTDENDRQIFKADYILAIDKIRDFEYEMAKKLNLPIVFIDRKKIYKRPTNEKYIPVIKREIPGMALEYQDKGLNNF